jgi:PKD repeat protein
MGLYGGQPNMGGSSNSFIYNNTLYKNGGVAIKLNQNGSSCVDVVMKNNISYKNVGGFSQYEGVNPANQHEINNFNGNPYFADEGNNDFHLIFGSPCIDAGAFLTNTRQAGSGTTILVENAGYFIDGFGIVEGDIIQLQGQTQTAKIISVDYSGNTLSINGFLEWTSGQGVSLAYSGSAPDIGAFEYESSVPPQLSAVIEANSTSGQPPLNVTFTGSATGGTAPYSYSWNFGDDQASTSQNPFHAYTSEGDYTATLTVTDNKGANAVESQVITVTKAGASLAAAISATPTSGQAPLNVNFTGSATGGTAPYSYSWNFGDGQTSTSQNPSYTYASGGDYAATLTVTDNKGANAVASQVITVTKTAASLAAAIFATPTSGQAPLKVTFTGTATGGTAPYSYSWNFGDGQTSTSQNPSNTYASGGDYTATLTVTDNQGANAVASRVITVTKAAPLLAVSIKASRTSGPAPLKITFSAKLNRGIRPKTYSWSFGDGKASSASKPTHKYTLPGTYIARLTLSDSKGAKGSASVIITARSKKT